MLEKEEIERKRILVVEWGDFIRDLAPWSLFYTQTFRESVHPERAHKIFLVAVTKIAREIRRGAVERKDHEGTTVRLQYARGSEYQKRGVLHYHALLSMPGLESWRWEQWQKWCWDNMGFLKIEYPRSQGDVAGYISKYLSKDGEIDLGLV